MKTKLVLRGTKGSDEIPTKVLIALELKPEDNRVYSWLFAGDDASEEFAKQLTDSWMKGEAVVFPDDCVQASDDLSPNRGLLPEGILPEKEELIKRKQTEWLFIVLSTRLFKNYESELSELEEKIGALDNYSKEAWSEMKEFWAKIQTQSKEQNLSKEHTHTLRTRANDLFTQLKKLYAVEEEIFEKEAKENYGKLDAGLKEIETKLEQDEANWYQLFEKLKNLQRAFHDARLTKTLRSKLWKRIDHAFKVVKAKWSTSKESGGERLSRRIEGLQGAISKMEASIKRDEKELDFQIKRINASNTNQLETQLREVRAKLIRERIDSKRIKLKDMHKTIKELQVKLTKIEKRNKAKKEKEATKTVETTEETQESAELSSEVTTRVADQTTAPEEQSEEDETPE